MLFLPGSRYCETDRLAEPAWDLFAGVMTLFFFMVSLELKRELVLGELRSPRMAALLMAVPPLSAKSGALAMAGM